MRNQYEFVGGPLQTIVGLDQIVGADEAVSQPGLGRFARQQSMMGNRPSQGDGQVRVQAQPYRGVREFPIGFGPTSVAANTTATFTAQPQLIFRPSRLIIPSSIAASFVVSDLRIGKNSQLVSANPIPASTFIETAVGVALGLDTCNVGQTITLVVANTTGGAVTFLASLIGTSVE